MSSDTYVCFTCRIAFVRPPQLGRAVGDGPSPFCGQCKGVLSFGGPRYKPPHRSAAGDWAIDAELAKHGLLSFSPRYEDGVPPPLQVSTPRALHLLLKKMGFED